MNCEKCGGNRAFYAEDADMCLCQMCYEDWADRNAQDLELQAERDASYLEASSPHPSEGDNRVAPTASEGSFNPPLTTLH